MKTIDILNKMEIGLPIVVILNNKIRCVSIYLGNNEAGIYKFIDDSGIYECTTGYIKDHITLDEIKDDMEVVQVAKLIEKIKK